MKQSLGGDRFWGEFTAFLALFLDNVGSLVFLSALMVFVFHYPADLVLSRMLPGTAVGVFLGDLVYTGLAIRLGKQEGRMDVTAMPLGIDTPSTIGMVYAVLGPVYLASHDAELTWHVGMATLFMIGCVKVVVSFSGSFVQKMIPTAGLLGPLAGIGLLFLGFLPLVEMFTSVVVGLTALGLIFVALLSRLKLPGNIPAILVAVLFGTGLHLLLGYGGYLPDFQRPRWDLGFSLPVCTLSFFHVLPHSLQYMAIAVPFGILTIVGGINNTESARLAGDNYRTRDILLTEALTSLIAAFFGGVAQTTPYIGHPAYKKMGATFWYTLFTAIFVGLGAITGFISLLVSLIPRAVIAPIFLYIGFEIVRQAFEDIKPQHYPAVCMSVLPAVASLIVVELNQLVDTRALAQVGIKSHGGMLFETLTILGNGFIVTGMLWGSMVAFLIDEKGKHAAFCAFLLALLTLFGITHSVLPTGEVYLPWWVERDAHYWVASGYGVMMLLFLVLRRHKG